MSMSNQEAIRRIQQHMEVHNIGEYPHIHIAEALNMAIAALNDQEHADQPLTIPELREMNGATVYCLELNAEVTVRAKRYDFIDIEYKIPGTIGTHSAHGLTLYRNTPEDARAWTKEEASRWKS